MTIKRLFKLKTLWATIKMNRLNRPLKLSLYSVACHTISSKYFFFSAKLTGNSFRESQDFYFLKIGQTEFLESLKINYK